jgi:hypothetical protein
VEHDELIARNTRAFEDLSAFLHDQTFALHGLTRQVRALTREIREHTARSTAEMRAQREEFRLEMRAQREGLFRIFDRLDRNDRRGDGAPG